MEHFWVIFF